MCFQCFISLIDFVILDLSQPFNDHGGGSEDANYTYTRRYQPTAGGRPTGADDHLAADVRAVHPHANAGRIYYGSSNGCSSTARRVVRRATPAPLKGVSGRPTRACALPIDNERPSLCDQSTEPETPHATTADTRNTFLRSICFITSSLSRTLTSSNEPAPLIFVNVPISRFKLC
jgi:hypothetical protein